MFEVAGSSSSGIPTWWSPVDFFRYTHVVLVVVVCCGSMWPRSVVFTRRLFLLSGLVPCRLGFFDLRRVEGSFPVQAEASVVGLCCVSPVHVLVSHVADCCTGTLGDCVVFCTLLLFDVICLVELPFSDCSCLGTPGRFLHHGMGRFDWSGVFHFSTTGYAHHTRPMVSLPPQRGDSTPGRLFEHRTASDSGTTMFRGIVERMTKELTVLAPSTMKVKQVH